jgi:type IX secretion system PorP/SprF family membrane protein
MKKAILLSICIITSLVSVGQANYQANLYMLNQQLINPAYAGKDYNVRASLLANNQLIGIPSSPKLFAFSLSSPIKLSKASLGLDITHQEYGVNKHTHISGIYAYRLPFKKSSLVFGLRATLANISHNNAELSTSEPGDERFLENANAWGYNFGGGLYYTRERSFISLSSPSWVQNTQKANGKMESIMELSEMPLFLSVGHESKQNRKVGLNSYFLLRYYPTGGTILDLSFALDFQKKFWVGPYLKSNSQYGLLLGANFGPFVKLGYSAGISQQARDGFAGSNHEVSMIFKLKDKKVKTNNSLRFF